MDTNRHELISRAAQFRRDNEPEKALEVLFELRKPSPDNPEINYQIAWTYDSMGKESDAVPFYEEALAKGLFGNDREGAFLGLGSTYRCLGEYKKSQAVLERGVAEFPDSRALNIFYALTLYNCKKSAEAIGILLNQLLDTTGDSKIKSYDRALRFYADKLDEVWK